MLREFKDPTVLKPQFEPLFARYSLVFEQDASSHHGLFSLLDAIDDFFRFVGVLRMGAYYSDALMRAVGPIERLNELKPESTDAGTFTRHRMECMVLTDRIRDQLRVARIDVRHLVVEMLRYQDWPATRI